jgi:putative resolvase
MWKVAEFGELIGVSSSTLQRWEGGKSPNRAIIYCRVSSSNQKDDLASQVKAME